MIFAVDVSVAIKWFVEEEGRAEALTVLQHAEQLLAPDLFFAEFSNVLWKKLRRGQVTGEQAADAREQVSRFISHVEKSSDMLSVAWEFSQRLDHSVYDCLYLACADKHDVRLVTADSHLSRKLENAGLGGLAFTLKDAAEALVQGNLRL